MEDLEETFVDENGDVWDSGLTDKLWELTEELQEEEEARGKAMGCLSLGEYYVRASEEATKHRSKEAKEKVAVFRDYLHRLKT